MARRLSVGFSSFGLVMLMGLMLVCVFSTRRSEAVPAGFSTFFSGKSCPSGWTELATAQGRLILSVAEGNEVGVTVNQPLAPEEDRVHSHDYSETINLPSKSIAADNCCNNQGAQSGDYPVSGTVESETSGLPYVQMTLCTLSNSNSDPVPFGTVAYFEPTIDTCPPSWSAWSESDGRFIIAGYDEKGVVVSESNPLASGEDRQHFHDFTISVSTNDVSYAGVDGCCNSDTAADGTYNTYSNATDASSGIPYIQLLTCVSQAPTFNASFPAGTLLFNEIACPPGWNVTFTSAGRFIVALPDGGVPGATFGTDSLPPGATFSPSHYHQFQGSVNFGSTGVGLASGCCGDGYAESNTYYFDGSTNPSVVDLPYLTVPMCQQLA